MSKKESEFKPKKGIKRQFFGCVLLSLGFLNTLLSVRAGVEPGWFNYLMIIFGSIFLGTGIWQARS
ncbi:MAG: hypothetical protein HYS21_14000 [Deltaproteobacteria bacterium]|nr:hypothetical protein [Deltaproteobacteria bacterium]